MRGSLSPAVQKRRRLDANGKAVCGGQKLPPGILVDSATALGLEAEAAGDKTDRSVAWAAYFGGGGIGITPVNTYACSMAIIPMSAPPAIENQNTRRKMGPSA